MYDRVDVRRAERLENTGSGGGGSQDSSPSDLIEGAESTGGGVKSRSSFVYHK